MTKTLDLAKALIKKASITPNDMGCQELMIGCIKPLGFNVELMNYGNVQNFYARKGNTAPLIVFAGHTDVVPPGPIDQWKFDPFSPSEEEGLLYGRGSADMKSSLAAFIVAIQEFTNEYPNHNGSIGLLITADEEGIATDGTVKVVEALKARNEKIDYCVVGEPTSSMRFGDTVKNGRRGSLSAKLIVKGIQGHIAYPELIRNPIHEVAPVIDALVNTVWDEGNEYFPKTSWQISNINGGTGATNVVPGEVEILFNFRYSTSNTADTLKKRVESILEKHSLDYEISWNHSGNPYLTEKGMLVDKISDAIESVVSIKPSISTTGGTSDGRFISTVCDQVVEFGPINASIHKINEHVNIGDIELLKDIYKKTLKNILCP
ncbi:MAG: succinyl-diaminopimelate desuccinylase [Nitrosomonadales bacterium]|jgi:succinyl-diaminopimelate desuccinylase|nr:MAG: succinyl-diaminopimelate desuccinylase [Methylophilales bacterium BACL14 MAG-120920-bin58]MBT6391980.1 succinyl-diaminopimelate desuccinylase [Nitrosomonadales bacterium]|tara:strand:- start:31028 stop:32158 length:1131 start_codon:yes stop_codon:yes gene_type:complete